MSKIFSGLSLALGQVQPCPVYYLSSTHQALLEMAAAMACAALQEKTQESCTRLEGTPPNMGALVAAAGTISFFGTLRVVYLRQLALPALPDKDAGELAQLFTQLENSVLIISVLHKDKKAATGKKAKALFAAAQSAGFAIDIPAPTRQNLLEHINHLAARCGAAFAPGAAQELLERVGDNYPVLENEVEKLAALCAYKSIGLPQVQRMVKGNIQADVFELSRSIVAGQQMLAQQKLAQLLALKYEPIMISGALAGNFIDMYRVRIGQHAQKSTAQVFKQLGYTGSEYRLQKAKESAAGYTNQKLEECILCLATLDKQLKSSALPDKSILLQAALAQLLALGAG